MSRCAECDDEEEPRNLETCEWCERAGLCEVCLDPDVHECGGDEEVGEDELDFGDEEGDLWEEEG